MKKTIITFFFLVLLLILPVTAGEIVIETDGAGHFLTLKSDNPVNISGYFLQLNVSGDTAIQSLEMLPPFEGAVNIRNDLGFAKIAAFTAIPSTSNRLAKLSYTGTGEIQIIVFEITDENLREIPVSNAVIVTDTPVPADSLPVYQPLPQYKSPGGNPSNPGVSSPAAPATVTTGISLAPGTVQPISPLTSRQVPGQLIPDGKKINESSVSIPAGITMDTTKGMIAAAQPTGSGISPTRKAGLQTVLVTAALGILVIMLAFRKSR